MIFLKTLEQKLKDYNTTLQSELDTKTMELEKSLHKQKELIQEL